MICLKIWAAQRQHSFASMIHFHPLTVRVPSAKFWGGGSSLLNPYESLPIPVTLIFKFTGLIGVSRCQIPVHILGGKDVIRKECHTRFLSDPWPWSLIRRILFLMVLIQTYFIRVPSWFSLGETNRGMKYKQNDLDKLRSLTKGLFRKGVERDV